MIPLSIKMARPPWIFKNIAPPPRPKLKILSSLGVGKKLRIVLGGWAIYTTKYFSGGLWDKGYGIQYYKDNQK